MLLQPMNPYQRHGQVTMRGERTIQPPSNAKLLALTGGLGDERGRNQDEMARGG